MTYTQYGKSHTVAVAVLTRVATFPEPWAIVSGRKDQAKIIMGYIIKHTFDNDYTKSKIIIPKGEDTAEALLRERSKNRMTFRHTDGNIGEVYVLSGDVTNAQAAGDALMGFGAPNVVLDEASLVPDNIEAKVFRMLGQKKDNFYCKIGNPFNRNHFHKDYIDKNFWKIDIGWEQGVEEGRITREFIAEAQGKPLFDILYNNKFPPKDMIDDQGFVPLLAEKDLRIIDDMPFVSAKRMGNDPAGGGSDKTKWVVRDNFIAKSVATEQTSDAKSIATKMLTLMEELTVKPNEVTTDNFGVGANVAQEVGLSGKRINAVNVGIKEFPDEESKARFYDLRSYAYWQLREWLIGGGQLVRNSGWEELLKLKYRVEANGKIKVMSKELMRKAGIPSPDTADALMLTFVDGPNIDDIKVPKIKVTYGKDGAPEVNVEDDLDDMLG
jgi:hypothetical protein